MAINNAVSKMQNFYQPVKSNPEADFDNELQKLIALNPADTTKYPWTDIGAGKLFADFYKDALRYVPERRTWFDYQAGIWTVDIGGLKAMYRCLEFDKDPYVFNCKNGTLHLDGGHCTMDIADCEDLAEFCELRGLSLEPTEVM